MRFLKLMLAYDGTDFDGWQIQPGRRTVQQTLQDACQNIAGHAITTIASGRTDAGVHALEQVVSFRTELSLPCDVLLRALNANLPDDVVALKLSETREGFHAIRDARRKTYRYVIQDGQRPDVFGRAYCWWVPQRLDVSAMQQAAGKLLGKHDFSSFESSGSERATSIRTIFASSIVRDQSRGGEGYLSGDRLIYEVTADGFLYNMVRSIVGTLYDVGRGAFSPEKVREILQAKDRKAASMTAPPQGLFLVNVEYDTCWTAEPLNIDAG